MCVCLRVCWFGAGENDSHEQATQRLAINKIGTKVVSMRLILGRFGLGDFRSGSKSKFFF